MVHFKVLLLGKLYVNCVARAGREAPGWAKGREKQ